MTSWQYLTYLILPACWQDRFTLQLPDFFFSSRRRHTRCALVTGVQTCALPIFDPAWPKMSIADANAELTDPGARFEMETVAVGGIPTRVWKNAPHDTGALLDLSRTHGDRLFTILDDERVTYEANTRATATQIGRASCRERVCPYV